MVVVRRGGVLRETHTHGLTAHTGCAHARRAHGHTHTHLRLRTFSSFHIDTHRHTISVPFFLHAHTFSSSHICSPFILHTLTNTNDSFTVGLNHLCVCEFVRVHTERSEVTYNQIIPPFLIFRGLCLDLRSALRELFCLLSALRGGTGVTSWP